MKKVLFVVLFFAVLSSASATPLNVASCYGDGCSSPGPRGTWLCPPVERRDPPSDCEKGNNKGDVCPTHDYLI